MTTKPQAETELFNLGMAYYRVCRLFTRMDTARFHKGNRTEAYCGALATLDHVRNYLWDEIRSYVVYFGINGDPILDRAWTATREERLGA